MVRKAIEVLLKFLFGQIKGQFNLTPKALYLGLAVGGLIGLLLGLGSNLHDGVMIYMERPHD